MGRWPRLPGLLDDLLGTPERLAAMHEAALRWWRDELSPTATARRIARALGV